MENGHVERISDDRTFNLMNKALITSGLNSRSDSEADLEKGG